MGFYGTLVDAPLKITNIGGQKGKKLDDSYMLTLIINERLQGFIKVCIIF